VVAKDLWLERAALKQLKAMNEDDASSVRRALERFAVDGSGDVRKLRGTSMRAKRLRVGRFRAIFVVSESEIVVLAISDRKEAYR
jgi:mRNA-degrading endonuclease RelE of RelBE toxin-antitoxin system